MIATEFFGITDIEINKVKTIKNDNGNYNCITTVDYQSDKYILNLEAEKEGDSYTVDMKSLENDSKDNKAFKEKVSNNFNDDFIADNFNFDDIENAIKENLERGIVELKMDEKLSKKKSSPCPDIDF
ncbi:hypothetical protein C1H69_22905 [Billgrantia endophytica]|uniref:Uncharacterized protein n=2 Tax=Billgrantia endophytica TaxID=2033802 RepID=A0A2N7TUD8_9GAMM|nr:hypothetical protein C1H69_22905 [Halomonas endophytica]